jgi:hypothetical protein
MGGSEFTGSVGSGSVGSGGSGGVVVGAGAGVVPVAVGGWPAADGFEPVGAAESRTEGLGLPGAPGETGAPPTPWPALTLTLGFTPGPVGAGA